VIKGLKNKKKTAPLDEGVLDYNNDLKSETIHRL